MTLSLVNFVFSSVEHRYMKTMRKAPRASPRAPASKRARANSDADAATTQKKKRAKGGKAPEPDADTMSKLNQAREILNKMFVENTENLDVIIWDCRVYLTAQQELLDENTRLRSMMGAACAEAAKDQLEASASIKEATNELSGLGKSLEQHEAECAETLGALRAQEASAARDYEVGMMIMNATEKTWIESFSMRRISALA